MAYTATVSSRLSQFGATEVTFYLVDPTGVMPDRSMAYNLPTETPGAAGIAAARAAAIALATQVYQDHQTQIAADAARRDAIDAFKQRLGDWLDGKVLDLNAQLQAAITASALTPAQKIVASQAAISWSLT